MSGAQRPNSPKIKGWQSETGTYIILALALGAMVFFGICSPQGFVDNLDKVAASVGGDEISQAEFSRAYSSASDQARKRYRERAATMPIAKNTLEQLIKRRVLFLEAQELALTSSEGEILKMLPTIPVFQDKEGKFSEEAFRQFLRSNRYTEESFIEAIQRDLTVSNLQRFVVEAAFVSSDLAKVSKALSLSKINASYINLDPSVWKVSLSDPDIEAYLAKSGSEEEIKQYYDSHDAEFNSPEKVRARHILIGYKGASRATPEAEKRSEAEAEKRAGEILRKVKASGADFAAIAGKETDEPGGAKRGGDLGEFSRDMMVKEFSDAAFSLTDGSISDVIRTPFGFHIIKVEKRIAAKEEKLEQVKRKIASKLLQKKRAPEEVKKIATDLLARLQTGEDAAKLLHKHKLKWQDTGEFRLDAKYIPSLGSKEKLIAALIGLKEDGQLLKEPVKIRNSLYIFKLKSRKIVKPQDITKEDARNTARLMATRSGYRYFNQFTESAVSKLEERNEIFRNPQYLNLDQQQTRTR